MSWMEQKIAAERRKQFWIGIFAVVWLIAALIPPFFWSI